MLVIQLIQRCKPSCARNQHVIAKLDGVLGFGTLGESGGLFVTDGGTRVCVDERCPICGWSITCVTHIEQEG